MMKQCAIRGRVKVEDEFDGCCCGWCEKIEKDVLLDWQQEFSV